MASQGRMEGFSMKQSTLIPRIIKLVRDNNIEEFTSNTMMQIHNRKYKNSVSSNQMGQVFWRYPQFMVVDRSNEVYIYKLKEGVV